MVCTTAVCSDRWAAAKALLFEALDLASSALVDDEPDAEQACHSNSIPRMPSALNMHTSEALARPNPLC